MFSSQIVTFYDVLKRVVGALLNFICLGGQASAGELIESNISLAGWDRIVFAVILITDHGIFRGQVTTEAIEAVGSYVNNGFRCLDPVYTAQKFIILFSERSQLAICILY